MKQPTKKALKESWLHGSPHESVLWLPLTQARTYFQDWNEDDARKYWNELSKFLMMSLIKKIKSTATFLS